MTRWLTWLIALTVVLALVLRDPMLALVAQDAPSRTILCAGAGSVEAAHITLTQGTWIGLDANAPERLVEQMDQVRNRDGEMVPQSGAAQGTQEVGRATRQLAGS